MLRAIVYTQSAKTSGHVNKSTMSATTQATTDNTQSHVTRYRDREDGVRSENSHPSSVRGGGSISRAASRLIASRRTLVAGRKHLTGRASNSHGGTASTSGRASNSLRSNDSTISRRAQSLRWRGVLPGDGINPRGASGLSQRSSVSLVGHQPSTVGVHHRKFSSIFHPMLTLSQYIH